MLKNNSGAVIGRAAIGASRAFSFVNVDTVHDLDGVSIVAGGDVLNDFDVILDDDWNIIGFSHSKGLIGKGVDNHVKVTRTETIASINIPQVFEQVKDFAVETYQAGKTFVEETYQAGKRKFNEFISLFRGE